MPPLPDYASTELLLGLKTRKDLASWLGVSDRALRYMLYRLGDGDKYSTFSIRKRNGGLREIHAPKKALKYLQNKVAHALAGVVPVRQIAKGYVPGRSIYDHAKMHRSKKWVVLVDLKSFFPSINFGRVLGLLRAPPFSLENEVAVAVAQLCTRAGELPQGAPSSPVISNLICRKLDRQLLELAKQAGCGVSRYADDICFSTNRKRVSVEICDFVNEHGWVPGAGLKQLICSNGFEINFSKFRVHEGRDRKLVTGLVVNKGVSTPSRWRDQLRSSLHVIDKYGEAAGVEIISGWTSGFFRKEPGDVLRTIRGKLGYLKWIDKVANHLATDALRRNFPSLASLMPISNDGVSFRIMAEGPTDLLHLEAALDYLRKSGGFLDVRPRFQNFLGDVGDSELWETLLRIAKADVNELTIGVFDCDSPAFMKKTSLVPGGNIQLGPRVYAFCLAPPGTGISNNFCIESLYSRSDATLVDGSGRRLFFGDEFDSASGFSHDGLYKCLHPKKKAIVVSDQVARVHDGASVLLSKAGFASQVKDKAPPFDVVSFDGFRPTWLGIRALAIAAVRK